MKYIFPLFFLIMPFIINANDTYTYATIEEHRSHQQWLKVEGGNIAYLDLGQGEPILLIHGLPTSSWLYRHIIADLVERGYRVIAPDLLGYGTSDKPQDYDLYLPDKQADRILKLMDHLGIQQWTHVMHDVGGLWSWETLMKVPERVSRLVILDTIAYEEGFKPPVRFKRKGWFGKFIIGLYDKKLIGKIVINNTLRSGTNKHKFTKEEKRGYWLPMQEGCNKAIYQFFTSYADTQERLKDYHKMFETLDIPAGIVWGEKDKFLIGEIQIPMLQKALNIEDKNVLTFPDAAHFIQEEKPKEITDFICKMMGE